MRYAMNLVLVVVVLGGVGPAAVAADKDAKPTPKVVKWEKDLDTAYKKSLEVKKPLVIVFLCPLDDVRCVHCKRFRGSVFSDEFAEVADAAVFVQVVVAIRKGEKATDELAQRAFEKLGCKSVPTVSVLEPNPKMLAEIARLKGYLDGKKAAEFVREKVGKWDAGGRKLTVAAKNQN